MSTKCVYNKEKGERNEKIKRITYCSNDDYGNCLYCYGPAKMCCDRSTL